MADVTISNLSNLAVSSGLLLPVSNGTTTGKLTIGDINSLVTKTSLGLSNVENKSSATIRSEIVSSNLPSGCILQVVQAYKTDSESITEANVNTYRDVPGMSCSITPKDSNSKILVSSILSVDGATLGIGCRLLRNGIAIGNATTGNVGNRNIGAGWVYGTSFTPYTISNQFLDSSVYTFGDSITYKLQTQPLYYNNKTYYINRSIDGQVGLVSSLTLMEIAG